MLVLCALSNFLISASIPRLMLGNLSWVFFLAGGRAMTLLEFRLTFKSRLKLNLRRRWSWRAAELMAEFFLTSIFFFKFIGSIINNESGMKSYLTVWAIIWSLLVEVYSGTFLFVPEGSDFAIENIPFGVVSTKRSP